MAKLPKAQYRALIDQVKASVSILDIAEGGGIGLRHEGSCYKGLCPFHEDSATESFAIYPEQGRWRCFGACQDGGDVLGLYMKLHSVKFNDALEELAGRVGVTIPDTLSRQASRAKPQTTSTKKAKRSEKSERYETPPPFDGPVDLEDLDHVWPYDRAEAVYAYPIVGGGEAHEVRYLNDGKKRSALTRPTVWGLVYGLSEGEYYRKGTCWRRVNDKTPKGAERKSIAEARMGLYRPDVFRKAKKGEEWVFLVEGPKDADTGIELGLYATSSPNGAAGIKEVQVEELRGHLVAVVGDHDEAGDKGAKKRAKMLRTVAREVRVLPPLGGAPGSGYDLTDFVEESRRGGASDKEIVKELLGIVGEFRPKPEVIVTTEEFDVNTEALNVLARSEKNLFQRFSALVHVLRADTPSEATIVRPAGSPLIRPIPEGHLRELLANHCRFVKLKGEDNEEKVPVHPPHWCVRGIATRGEWEGVQKLESVVEGPVIRSDGTLLQTPGFDRKSGLLYIPSTDYAEVPEKPTRHDVEGSLDLLREVVCDFPFRSEHHFSAWLSALLTPLARFAFAGPSPLNLIDANVRGAGKSLLADVCNMIVTGRPAARMSYNSRNEDELRKAITSVAMNGDQIVLIDNIRGSLGDATLDRALTATTWKDRLLGSNTAMDLPLDVTWYATGNNVVLTADTARRCLHIRLESPEEHPEQRTEFRHPRLLSWIRQERPRILPAALSLLRAWWDAGRPRAELSGFGSYEEWSDTVRQCVVWLGLPDPAETRVDLEDSSDVEACAVTALIEGLEELLSAPHLLGEGTAGEILDTLKSASSDEYRPLREALVELVSKVKPGELPTTRQLGGLLRRHRGKYVAGACLTVAKEKTKRGALWAIRRKGAGDSGDSGDSARGSFAPLPSPPHQLNISSDPDSESPESPESPKSGSKGDSGDEDDSLYPYAEIENPSQEGIGVNIRNIRRGETSSLSSPESPGGLDDDDDDDRPPY